MSEVKDEFEYVRVKFRAAHAMLNHLEELIVGRTMENVKKVSLDIPAGRELPKLYITQVCAPPKRLADEHDLVPFEHTTTIEATDHPDD